MNPMFNLKDYKTKELFLSEIQKSISQLDDVQKQTIICELVLSSNGCGRYSSWVLPCDTIIEENYPLWESYLLAILNNIIVTYGGEKLTLFYNLSSKPVKKLFDNVVAEFQLDNCKNNRTGFGVYINYINRMNPYLELNKFSILSKDISYWQPPKDSEIIYLYGDEKKHQSIKSLKEAALSLEGKVFCSLDVGGNSIKGAVIQDGEICVLKEHRWYPSSCKTSKEMLTPILCMIRVLRQFTHMLNLRNKDELVRELAKTKLSDDELERQAKVLEHTCPTKMLFDAIVIGFPDIVVKNKIAGGETFKQIGIKKQYGDNYDEEFTKISDLDILAGEYVKKDGSVTILNDGNAASFLTSVEQAFSLEEANIEKAMFVNTIGTEMGTGLVTKEGTVQHYPLEGYQKIIDLGNLQYKCYPANDIRSLCSLSTGLCGTVQKYITQLGLFRMAIMKLYQEDREEYNHLIDEGYIVYNKEKDYLYVNTDPIDRRGDLTRYLIGLLQHDHPVLIEVFKEMGRAMGILIDQGLIISPEVSTTRLLSGGIVASDSAFEALVYGLKEYNENYDLIRLDEANMQSPLMQKMGSDQRNFNVAIGGAYLGNYSLKNK